MVAFLTGGAWAMYFTDAPTLVSGLFKFQIDELSLIFIALFTSTTYLLGGWAAGRLGAGAGLYLHVPVAANPGRHDR